MRSPDRLKAHRRLLCAAALLAAAQPMRAQVIAGAVVQPDSVTPLARVIVVAKGAGGVATTRAVTGSNGAFTLRVPAPGRYELTVLRIGYRPSPGGIAVVGASDTTRVHIVANPRVVALPAVGVRERSTCRVSADTGLAVARVWEEARKAMLTSQLGNDAPVVADWVEFHRTLDSTSRIVRQQRVQSARHPTTHAFRSVPADSLHAAGYVVADAVGVSYYAPDVDVLLSESFMSDHCFRLVDSEDRSANRLGVAFEPIRARREMREIAGTFWIDRSTSELRSLEFRYVNLPDPAAVARPGGSIEFLRLPTGNWLVSRWQVRMPDVAIRPAASALGTRRTVQASSRAYLRAVQTSGGQVMRVMHGDSVLYRGAAASVNVQLTADSETTRAGATLALEGTDYTAIADSAGTVHLSPVLAGRYRATVRTALMQRLGMPAVGKEIETHAAPTVDTIALPGVREALASACPRGSMPDDGGMLDGRVRSERTDAIAGAVVTVTWNGNFSVLATPGAASLSYRQKSLSSRTDALGHWRVCGVPRGVPLAVRVAGEALADSQSVKLEAQPFASVDLVLRPRRVSSSALDASRTTAAPRVQVEIVVTDDRGNTLSGVAIELQAAAGRTPRRVATGPSGRVIVTDVARGRVLVSARRIGFAPGAIEISIDGEHVVLPIRLSALSAPMLDTIRVVGARPVLARHQEFESRRVLRQATKTVTRGEIEKRNPTATWQMLTGLLGITVTDREDRVVATSPRSAISRLDFSPCFFGVVIDGMPAGGKDPKGFDLRHLPPPDQVEGIEVFVGAASIPLQYGGIGDTKTCGLIAIWTR